MEVIRGREGGCRQEVCRTVERGRTRVSEAGEGWSDSRIAAALDVGIATIQRTRRQLVEEGSESVLTRKYNANSARPRIFDGAAEAKLIALTCRPAPAGYAKWSLRLLEEKVVELKDRIMAAMGEFNRHPVVHTWSYKLDQAA
jgi:transposase